MFDTGDKGILRLLQRDGRVTLTKMGEALGISHVSVRRRLKNLEGDVLKINPALGFSDLNFRLTLIFVEAENDDLRNELDLSGLSHDHLHDENNGRLQSSRNNVC